MSPLRKHTKFIPSNKCTINLKQELLERSNKNSVSLNKHISSTGICSRREAEIMIREGRVTINGEVSKLGNRVFSGDEVRIDGKKIVSKPKAFYIAFNKPIGIVSTTDRKEPKNIIDYINHKERLFPIGRLDKPSQGLIFLTNDGDIVNKILRSGNNHEKEYVVTVTVPITREFLKNMRNGVRILGKVTKRCEVAKIDDFNFKIILTQGMNRQIRRMCEALNYRVSKLKRVRIMNVKLGDLKIGRWRSLSQKEMGQINFMISQSSKTEEASKENRPAKKSYPKRSGFNKAKRKR